MYSNRTKQEVSKLKITEILAKAEELQANLTKLNDSELNRIMGYMEGMLAFKESTEEEVN